MKLKAERVGGDTLRSAALIFDEDLEDSENGSILAFVVYSDGGHVIYWHRDPNGYNLDAVLVAGETYFGEMLRADRIKMFDATVRKK